MILVFSIIDEIDSDHLVKMVAAKVTIFSL